MPVSPFAAADYMSILMPPSPFVADPVEFTPHPPSQADLERQRITDQIDALSRQWAGLCGKPKRDHP